MKPAIWRIFRNGRWSYSDSPSTRSEDRAAWQPLYAEKTAAEAEREKMKFEGIHSCHHECQNPACVAVRQAVVEEREACAKLVEYYCGAWDDKGFALTEMIRARGVL